MTEPIYIGLENPTEVRKALLEASKEMIKILQTNETLKEKREQKHQLKTELQETIKDISHLMTQLRTELPRVKLSSLPKRQLVTPKPAPPKETKQPEPAPMPKPRPKPIHITEAQRLEKELKEIETKLSGL